jgi:hypothetical protein
MTMKLAFGKTLLDAGKTMVVAAGQCATIRVHDGMVWATSSGNLDDVWLSAGQEHRLPKRGKTVIESTQRSTIEFVPPPANDACSTTPSLKWIKLPAWFDDVGALIALVAIVALMAVAGYQVSTSADTASSIQDVQRMRIPDQPAGSAG